MRKSEIIFNVLMNHIDMLAAHMSSCAVGNSDIYFHKWKRVLFTKYATYGLSEKNVVSGIPVYRYDYNINNQWLYFHFDIKQLAYRVSGSVADSVPLHTIRPFSEGTKYAFTPPEDNYITPNTSPIIAVPFFMLESIRYIIADGNHRTSQAIKNDDTHIEVRTASIDDTGRCIMGEFERALYYLTSEASDPSVYQTGSLPFKDGHICSYIDITFF